MKLRNLALILVLAGAVAFAFAVPAPRITGANAAAQTAPKTFTHEAGGITFELPDGWKAEPDGDQLTVSPAEGGVSVVFWVTEDDGDDSAKALGEELAKQIQELKFDGEPKADKHNGMDHSSVTGSGKLKGKEIHFSADILEAKRTVIVLTMGTMENLQKHSAEYAALVKSIKKVG